MTCSLTGEFIDYSATYQNSNPIGRTDVSLIDNVTIYQLIHAVRIDEPVDDGISDFLTNEIPNPNYLADHVHSSSQNQVFLVYATQNFTQIVNKTSSIGTMITIQLNTITNFPNNSYIYAQLSDFYDSSVSLTSVIRSFDSKSLMMGDNVQLNCDHGPNT